MTDPQLSPEEIAAVNAAARAEAQALPPIDPGQILTPEQQKLNNRAMDLAFFARREKSRGRRALAQQWFRMALHYELENLAGYGIQSGLLASIAHRSAGWLALDAYNPALARELAQRGLENDPHPAIKPELADLLQAAEDAIAFPEHEGHQDRLPKDPPWRPIAYHPNLNTEATGRHAHHAGYPDAAEPHFRHQPANTAPREEQVMEIKLKRYADRQEAEEALEDLQMHDGFQEAFLNKVLSPEGRTEYLLGLYAPSMGRMLLIDEDQQEARQIDHWEQAAAAAPEE